MDIYKQKGYADRYDYLSCMAEEHDVPMDAVEALADLLGPDEDFDGLINALQDLAAGRVY